MSTASGEFWAGTGDDLQEIIDQAPEGSTVYVHGVFRPGIILKSGIHLQGVTAEEFAARELGHGIRSMTDAVIGLRS